MASTAFDIKNIINNAAQSYGVEPDILQYIAQVESNFNTEAKNPNSSAKGLFQFIDKTANQYGLSNPYDPVASSDAAARLTRDNIKYLEKNLGRKPTKEEIYLSHQQGPTGLLKLMSNPDSKASDVVGNSAVTLNLGDHNTTSSQFLSQWGISADKNSSVYNNKETTVNRRLSNNNVNSSNEENDFIGNISKSISNILNDIGSKEGNTKQVEFQQLTDLNNQGQPESINLQIFEPSIKRKNPLDDYLKSLFT